MDDLTICKRIAEIEDKETKMQGNVECLANLYAIPKNWRASERFIDYKPFNPLTDDALCFQLMIKYEIKVSTYYKIGDRTPYYGAETPDLNEVEARTPQKVVCLAIIDLNDQ